MPGFSCGTSTLRGAATSFFRVTPRLKGGTERLVSGKGALAAHVRATDLPGLHLVPADFSLRHLDLHLDGRKRPTERLASLLEAVAHSYDVAILDCPPSISPASESVFGAAHQLLVPVIPTTLSSRTLGQLAGFFDGRSGAGAGRSDPEANPGVPPYLSMVDRRKRLHREVAENLRIEWPDLLATVIPSASVIERMGPERAPAAVFAPSAPAARAFRDLWAEVAGRLWG